MRLSEEEYHFLLQRSRQPIEVPRAPLDAPEKRFMGQIIQVARQQGWIHYHTWDSRKSPEGFPDLFLVKPEPCRGDVLALELKSARGKATMAQQLWLTALADKRIEARLVRPSDFADLVRLLQQG